MRVNNQRYQLQHNSILCNKMLTLLCSIGKIPVSFRSLTTLSSHRIFSQNEVNLFAELSGDKNIIHINEKASEKYGGPIVHGTLMLGHVSGMVASTLPGALLLHIETSFHHHRICCCHTDTAK
ncbi:hydroxyacyl-thioester dehydratase type 2, mitochondrial-like isoform X2 [Watersipora subatra]|uniref:hydroxyacyl-thioester dehydratase type 2, mitochondrial-like isoform X2 n=1 Tax=Watersipora subatra TaxID=2589382 RepID=UPI00355BFEFE